MSTLAEAYSPAELEALERELETPRQERPRRTAPIQVVVPKTIPPGEFIATIAGETIARWAATGASANSRPAPTVPSRYPDVIGVRDHIASAITRLRDRSGDRVESARQYLTGELARIEAAMHAFERLVVEPHDQWPSIGGPYVADWSTRYVAACEALTQARFAKAIAPLDQVLRARDDLELAEAFVRDIELEFRDSVAAAALPPLPERAKDGRVSALLSAEQMTEDLVSRARGSASCAAQREALNQGFETPSNVARLWIVFERANASAKARELFDLRWRAHQEASGHRG